MRCWVVSRRHVCVYKYGVSESRPSTLSSLENMSILLNTSAGFEQKFCLALHFNLCKRTDAHLSRLSSAFVDDGTDGVEVAWTWKIWGVYGFVFEQILAKTQTFLWFVFLRSVLGSIPCLRCSGSGQMNQFLLFFCFCGLIFESGRVRNSA